MRLISDALFLAFLTRSGPEKESKKRKSQMGKRNDKPGQDRQGRTSNGIRETTENRNYSCWTKTDGRARGAKKAWPLSGRRCSTCPHRALSFLRQGCTICMRCCPIPFYPRTMPTAVSVLRLHRPCFRDSGIIRTLLPESFIRTGQIPA